MSSTTELLRRIDAREAGLRVASVGAACVDAVNEGRSHIIESEYLAHYCEAGRFKATTGFATPAAASKSFANTHGPRPTETLAPASVA